MEKSQLRNKYKQLKYQHLKKIYHKNLNKIPSNCRYNKTIELPNRSKLNICGFNLEDNFEVDLCYKPDHAKNCNAFCPKMNKEDIYLNFVEELKDDQIRAEKYKDINVLFWLSPTLKYEDFPSKMPWYKRMFNNIKRYLGLSL